MPCNWDGVVIRSATGERFAELDMAARFNLTASHPHQTMQGTLLNAYGQAVERCGSGRSFEPIIQRPSGSFSKVAFEAALAAQAAKIAGPGFGNDKP